MRLLTSEQMREADRRTIDEVGLPGAVLMENAGAGVTRILKNRFADWQTKGILLLVGRGNNGGDGFVIARRLMQIGARVNLLLIGQAAKLKGDALLHYLVFARLGGRVREMTETKHLANLQSSLAHSGVLIDGVFGTGLERPVKGFIAQAFEIINQSEIPVMAIDIPSGVCSNTGKVLGSALKATWTVTMATEKIGHRLYPGTGLCGEIITIPIGIPQKFIQSKDHMVARNLPVDLVIPPRLVDGHKGTFGHLLIVAGSVGKEGAAALTALGAMRTGPGLVTVATPSAARPVIAAKLTEAMTIPLPPWDDEEDQAGSWVNSINNSDLQPAALAMGPGLGTQRCVLLTVCKLINQLSDVPVVLDADAINVLANEPKENKEIKSLTKNRKAPLVLTPHPGELAQLLDMKIAEIQEDRLGIAIKTATKLKIWLVLKGADSIIAAPDGRAWINDSGNSGLASGGSGDLLTGIIGGLLAQGWDVESAVRAGVWLHGSAADRLVANTKSAAGVLASDILPFIQELRNELG